MKAFTSLALIGAMATMMNDVASFAQKTSVGFEADSIENQKPTLTSNSAEEIQMEPLKTDLDDER